MPLTHLAKMPRRLQISLILFMLASALFVGALIDQVHYSTTRRSQICQQVKELRTDVVRAIDILSAKPQRPEVLEAKQLIRRPNC